MPILMITLSLYLFRDLCILGICTLLKMTFGTTNSLRKTPLLVLIPSENLVYRGGGRGGSGYKGEWPRKNHDILLMCGKQVQINPACSRFGPQEANVWEQTRRSNFQKKNGRCIPETKRG